MYGLITVVLFNVLLMLRHVLERCPSCLSPESAALYTLSVQFVYICLLHRLMDIIK